MSSFDICLRDIFQELPEGFVFLLTGKRGKSLLDTSLPSTKERKTDLLVELEDSSIFHLEIQTDNDKTMPFRMLEYYCLIKQKHTEQKITQVVLYVGDDKVSMPSGIIDDNIQFSYKIIASKDIDCSVLLKSDDLSDRLLAVLCKIENFEKYIDDLTTALEILPKKHRKDHIRKLLQLLDYRPSLKQQLIELMEGKKMPLTITEEMKKSDPFYKYGFEEGTQRGLLKGFQRGIQEGIEKSIIELYKNLNLSIDKIAKGLQLDEEYVKSIIEAQAKKK